MAGAAWVNGICPVTSPPRRPPGRGGPGTGPSRWSRARVLHLVEHGGQPGNTGSVADATWQAAGEAGWSDAELAELSAHLAANMFTNYFNHFVQTEPDLPTAPGLEGWSPRR